MIQTAGTPPAFNFSLWFPVSRAGKVSGRKLHRAAPPPYRGCFEQEEVRLEVGLDAVALGRNIDHGVGERASGERGSERDEGEAGGVSARPLFLFYLALHGGIEGRERERGARGQRDQLKRYNGPHSLHTHDGYTGCSLKEDSYFRHSLSI